MKSFFQFIRNNWLMIVLVIFFLTGGASGMYSWFNPKTVIQKVPVEVKVPKEIVKIKRVEIPVEKVKVIEKEKVTEEITVPEWLKLDVNKQITAVGTVPAHKGETEITAVFDIETGDTTLLHRQKRPPFFEFLNEKEIGGRFGLNTDGQEVDLFGRWTFARIGAFHAGLYAEMAGDMGNNELRGKAMIEVSYRW